jgi:large subunit ribosomal protein L34e
MHYATRGNLVRKIRTPGNRLKFQQVKKRSQGTHTPWVLGHKRIAGTKAVRGLKARTTSRHTKSVSRAYGGVLSADQVRDRVIRAFLVEEQRIARRMDLDKKKYKKLKVRRLRKLKKKKAKAAGSAASKKVVSITAKKNTKQQAGKNNKQQQQGGKKAGGKKSSIDASASKKAVVGAKLADTKTAKK